MVWSLSGSILAGKRKERPDSEVDGPKINPLAPVNDDTR